jgi:predicted lysophospholipase L1 biosynthesis ABC-type transport system permease subunit
VETGDGFQTDLPEGLQHGHAVSKLRRTIRRDPVRVCRTPPKIERTMQMLLAIHNVPLVVLVAIVAVVAIVLIGLLIWGARNPLVWRVLSVIGMGTGAGFLVWGILMAAMQQEPRFGSSAGIIAIGAGSFVGSITLLVISFCGSCRGRKE